MIGMYQDRESIKAFERIHGRDRAIEMARHIGDGSSSNQFDLFLSHARTEGRDGLVSSGLILAAVVASIGVTIWLCL